MSVIEYRSPKKKKKKEEENATWLIPKDFMPFIQSNKSWLFCAVMIKSPTDVASDYFM